MNPASQVEVENELKSLGSEQLRFQRSEIGRELREIEERIGDLAFNNYRTYADAGRTTQNCTKIFTEMSEKLKEVTADISILQTDLKQFNASSKEINQELTLIASSKDPSSALSEILSLPARMDLCIRSGYYEAAYTLTNYGMMMQQHAMVKNPLLKQIADRLVEARSILLEELFNKFSGSMDLAASLQVVNNVRKMPYLTSTQLRVSILQHKDIYLEKQLLDISSNADHVIAAIDVYRTCMHDTLVLYLSVFPENETMKKNPTVDPRWEQWPHCSPSCILGQWAARNINRLLDIIHRAEMKSGVDMASVWSKMMSVAATLGRMGLDFRPTIINSLCNLVIERFRSSVRQATNRLTGSVKVLNVANINLEASSHISIENSESTAAPAPSPEISLWDDLCVFGNDLITALNGLRYSHTTILVRQVVAIIREAFTSVFSWVSAFHCSPHFNKAVRILCLHFVPFISRSIRFLFPFSVVYRLFGASIAKTQYDSFTDFDVRALAATCDGSEKIEEVLLPMLEKKSLANIDIDAILQKPVPEVKDNSDYVSEEQFIDGKLDEDVGVAEGNMLETAKSISLSSNPDQPVVSENIMVSVPLNDDFEHSNDENW